MNQVLGSLNDRSKFGSHSHRQDEETAGSIVNRMLCNELNRVLEKARSLDLSSWFATRTPHTRPTEQKLSTLHSEKLQKSKMNLAMPEVLQGRLS